MKMANIDAVFDGILTCAGDLKKQQEYRKNGPSLKRDQTSGKVVDNPDRPEPLFYFADVCAGPGGFTEYMLWRKGAFNAKGFGFTLRGKDDFKLDKFLASSAEFFEPFYGIDGDGDVTTPANLESLEKFIKDSTDNLGVHLVMADGGFSVEGQENIQEILSKRLYLCQFLAALCIVRPDGNFVCKLFDLFTPFSVGLIYLMTFAFERISIHKPHTSRPANSERYIICDKMRANNGAILKSHLMEVNGKLDDLISNNSNDDVFELVPLKVLKGANEFYRYILSSNEMIAQRQTMYLNKYKVFAQNQGQVDSKQMNLREKCLLKWFVPNLTKMTYSNNCRQRQSPQMLFDQLLGGVDSCRDPKLMGGCRLSVRPDTFMLDLFKPQMKGHRPDLQLMAVCVSSFRLAAQEMPTLIIAVDRSVYVLNRDRWESPQAHQMSLPKDTLIFGEITEVFRGRGRATVRNPVVRILDAAVLAGDHVDRLPYSQRMLAIRKFCTALDRRKTNTNRMNAVFEPAEVWTVQQLKQHRHRMEVMTIRGEKIIALHQRQYNDDKTNYMICRGMRFFDVLIDPWTMCWSKSHSCPYAFNRKNEQKGFEIEHVDLKCFATFHDLLRRQSYFWNWAQDLKSGDDCYGPDVILSSDIDKNKDKETRKIPIFAEVIRTIEAIENAV